MNNQLTAVLLASFGIILFGGCNFASPTAHEKRVPAEYDLRRGDQKVMVYVDEGRSSRAGFNFRADFDDMIGMFIQKKVRVKKENIVKYDKYLPSRQSDVLGAKPTPAELGTKAGADLVLYVRIEKYGLDRMDARGYYSGSLVTRSLLMRTSDREVLWPRSSSGRISRVRVDFEKDGLEKTLGLLMKSNAHCITRHLYNCPTDEYRSGYEQTEYKINEI